MTEVNTDAMRVWVNALRSGGFQQGNGALHRISPEGADQYCCLGVACEAAIANGIDMRVEPSYTYLDTETGQERAILTMYDGEQAFMPVAVKRWLGVGGNHDIALGFDEDQVMITPIRANDYLKLSFAEIADRIEAAYLTEESS